MSRQTKAQKAEQREAIAKLREALWDPQGRPRQVLSEIPHVARSGMSRTISFRVMMAEPRADAPDGIEQWAWCIDSLIARGLGYPLRHDGVHVSGGGMDMVFATMDHARQAVLRQFYPEITDYTERQAKLPLPRYR